LSLMVYAVVFGIATFFSTFIGGYFAIKRRSDLPLFLGFAGGALIGVGFFDLLPGAASINIGGINYIFMSVVIGFLYYHVTQRTLAVHSHNKAVHEGVTLSPESESHSQPIMGKIGATGLVIHSFFDGFGIGAGFQVSFSLGLLVALAVVMHDFSDGLNTVTLMLKADNTTTSARLFLFADAAAPIVGVMTAFVILTSGAVLSYILAFFAGEFLCIGSSDLLPEAHAKEKSWRMIGLTLLGVFIIFTVTRFA